MTEDVFITGFGVVSPFGPSVEALTRHCAEEGAERAHGPAPLDDQDGGLPVAEIPLDVIPADKRSRIGRLDRLCRMFMSASYLAVDAARLTIGRDEAERVGLSFGTGLGCLLTNAEYNQKVVEQGPAAASPRLFAYTVSSAAAGEVSIALGIEGPNVTTHMGFAAGLGAVGYGFDLIQMGKADVVLAGGADVLGPALMQGLRDMGLLKTPQQSRPFRDAIAGVWPSEGAVVAVLERADRARQRGARCWGRIDGYAAGFEPSLTRRARAGTGVSATMRRALDLSGHTPDSVGMVLASAHGTPVDATERAALEEVFGVGLPLVVAPKAALGESFGTSGVLALALAAGLMREDAPFRLRLPLGEGPGEGAGPRDLFGGPHPGPLPGGKGAERLPESSVVMVNALCYSGNIVSMILARDQT